MNYTDFIYSQYTIQELTEIVAENKHNGKGLDAFAEECQKLIIRKHQEEQEAIQL
jgi:Cdc6-like AAA superfamily ATPase